MTRILPCSAFLLLIAGCAGPQLREATVDMGPAFGSLQERQILTNLSSFIEKPWSLPGQIEVTSGQLQIQNQATLGWKLPFTGTAQEFDPQGQSQEQDNFAITPVTDGDDLRRVRALYRYAICANPKEFRTDWDEAIEPYRRALTEKTLIPGDPAAARELASLNKQLSENAVDRADTQRRLEVQEQAAKDADATKEAANRLLAEKTKAELQSRQHGTTTFSVPPTTDGKTPAEEVQAAQKDATLANAASDAANDLVINTRGGLSKLSAAGLNLASKKATAAKAAVPTKKDKGSTATGDQNGPPDSVQLEEAKRDMALTSLGTPRRFVFWSDRGEKTTRLSPCPNIPPERASPQGNGPFYPLGSYGSVDLWTNRPEIFSKFMMLVIGSTPNTTGVHALTLGSIGNTPPKVLTRPLTGNFGGRSVFLQ